MTFLHHRIQRAVGGGITAARRREALTWEQLRERIYSQ